MKKTLLALSLVAATQTAFAQASNFEGLSIGLGLAAVGVDTKYQDTDDFNLKVGQTNVIPVIDLSYAYAVDSKFLVGVGATYDLKDAKSGSASVPDYASITLKAKSHYSIYVQPTYLMTNNTALFAKVGYHSMKGTAEIVCDDCTNDSLKFKGIGYGAGIKTFLDKNIFVQAEIQVVDYKKKSLADDDFTWSYKPKSTAGILSVGYKF